MKKSAFVMALAAVVALMAAGTAKADWTPAQLDTPPFAWYDASDPGTLHTNDAAGFVSQWDDKSGNGYHLVQTSQALQPATGTRNIGGRNVLDFSTDYMTNNFGTTYSQPLTGVVVFQNDSFAAFNVLSDGLTAGQRFNLWFQESGGDQYALHAGGASSLYGTNPRPNTSPHVWSALANGASSLYCTDGATNVTGSVGTDSLGGMVIGEHNSLGGYYYDGAVGEYIMLGTDSLEDRQKVEGYLAHKWGLEGNLPAGHPYKSSPPQGAATPGTLIYGK